MRVGVGVPLYGNASQTIHTVPAGPRPAAAPAVQAPRRGRRAPARALQPEHVRDRPARHPRAGPWASRPTTPSSRPGVLLDVFAPILRRWLGRLDAHVVVSEACIGSLAPYFPYQYRIIPNGIDDRHFSPEAEPLPELREGGKPLILFLGRFDPRNGLPTMLEAFQQVHAEHEGSVRLCVVGDGPLGNVYRRKLARARGRRRDLGRARRLVAPALLRVGRHPLHALPARLLRHGAAGGDEHAGARSWPAASRASSCSWSTASRG